MIILVYEKFESDLRYVHKMLEKMLDIFDECLNSKEHLHNNTVIISMLEEAKIADDSKRAQIVLLAHEKFIEIEQVCNIMLFKK